MIHNGLTRFRIRTILLLVNVTILVLPLGSIYFLKIYEDELIGQTESELVSQGAAIASVYQQTIEVLLTTEEFKNTAIKSFGIDAKLQPDGYYAKIPEKLELSRDLINPPFPDAEEPLQIVDPLSLEAGLRITPILNNTKQATLAGIRVTDYNGIIVASSGIEYGKSIRQAFEIARALESKPTSLLRLRVPDTKAYSWASTSRDTGLRVFVALPIIVKHRLVGTVLLSRTPRSIKKALYDKKERVLVALGLLLVIIILLTLFTSLTISRPVSALIKQTQAIASGKTREQIPQFKPVTREFELLSSALSEMAKQIETRSDYIRNFALQVSHEFKTPLTAIQGTIELFQNYFDTMDEEKRKQFLNNLQNDAERLKKLVNRLLEMARADVFKPGDESTGLMSHLQSMKELYAERKLVIDLPSNNPEVQVPISPEILSTIFSNLFDNSVQHGASQVSFELKTDEFVQVQYHDNGKGVSQANADKIFTPFFTTLRDEGGTGLGLPIIKTLIEAHDGQIEWQRSDSGAVFILRLPSSIPLS